MATSRLSIFISHSYLDNDFGIQLTQRLRGLLNNEALVWYDTEGGLKGGDTWWRSIVRELTTRDAFIIILSPDAMQSPWVQRELDIALNENKHIIPILYRQCEVRADLKILQMVSFLPPKDYDVAFNELLEALSRGREMESEYVTDTQPLSMPDLLPQSHTLVSGNRRSDWGEAPDVPVFFGRTKELILLEQWLTRDRCRLAALVGMRGIGKTKLSVKLGRGGIGKTDLFADLRGLLDWHFNRLSDLHKEVMHWFAINREPTALSELKDDILSPVGKEQITSTLHSLQRLIPLEKSAKSFTLQPVLIEYMTERFVEQVVEEIRNGEIQLFNTHALLKTSVSDYVRDIQRRLILKAISEKLLKIYGNRERLEARLKEILSLLRERFRFSSGYAAGNLLNLLCSLKIDLRGYNFSGLPVWQAYLRGVSVQEVNFAYANLATSVFTDTFGSILSVALSPHGGLLVAGTATGEIRLWHVASSLPLHALRGHTNWVSSVAFSPDGKVLASGSDDQAVLLWEVSSGRCLHTLHGHSHWVISVAFSPDGKVIASSSYDGVINLWNSQTSACLRALRSDRPYERMNITQVTGVSEAQKSILRLLGAIED